MSAALPAPRLLLVGRPGAGKTSLIGALVDAAADPNPPLTGTIHDPTGRVKELAKSVAAGQVPKTRETLVAYDVRFEPARGEGWSATLVDTSGEAGQEYLQGRQPLDEPAVLARAILSADGLLLVVDAAEPPADLQQDFAHFGPFLQRLEAVRGRRTEVAGMPVYLVLAKCDRLAHADDTHTQWMARIEAAKDAVAERFRTFLKAHAPPTFGDVRLHVWATAVRRPKLADRPAQPGPYGVAELFAQCVDAAELFRRRRDQSGHRLSLVVIGAILLLITFGAGGLLLSLLQPSHDLARLEGDVRALIPPPNAPAAERLRGTPAGLEARLHDLQQVQGDEHYAGLPAELRERVEAAERETAAYLRAGADQRVAVKWAFQAESEKELRVNEQAARDFALPRPYADAWADTRLVRELNARRDDYARLQKAVDGEGAWVRGQVKTGEELLVRANKIDNDLLQSKQPGPADLDAWYVDYRSFRKQPPPTEKEGYLPGVKEFPYFRLRMFEPIRESLRAWDEVKRQLDRRAGDLEERIKKRA